MQNIAITYACTVAQWNEHYNKQGLGIGYVTYSSGNPFGSIRENRTCCFFKRQTIYSSQNHFDYITQPDYYGINSGNTIYSKKKDIKLSITSVFPGNPVPYYVYSEFNPSQNPTKGFSGYLNPNLNNPDPTAVDPKEGICYSGVRLSTLISVAQKLTRPDTDRVDFTITISYEPYSFIQDTGGYTPNPTLDSTSTPPTYLEQRIALQNGINVKVVDLEHRDWGGYGEKRTKNNITNNNIKDEATAERIGRYAIEKSKRDTNFTIPAPPLLQLEPLNFFQTTVSSHSLEPYEPIDTLRFYIDERKMDFTIEMKGIGKR